MDSDRDINRFVPKRKVLRANKKPELWQYTYIAIIWGLIPVGCHCSVVALIADKTAQVEICPGRRDAAARRLF